MFTWFCSTRACGEVAVGPKVESRAVIPAKALFVCWHDGTRPDQSVSPTTSAGTNPPGWLKNTGIRLLPEMYACFNPMPFHAAVEMEAGIGG